MTGKRVILTACFVTALSLSPSLSGAQETQDQQKAMEMYLQLGSPNENHAYLAQFAGEWLVETTAWMTPGSEAATSTGTARAELLLYGRFLMIRFEGTMFGQPFEGVQIQGYDNMQKKFVTFWIDSTSTAFYTTSGTMDDEGVLTETAEWPDPMTGGTMPVKAVSRMTGPDTFVYEMYMILPDGTAFKSLENRLTRKK